MEVTIATAVVERFATEKKAKVMRVCGGCGKVPEKVPMVYHCKKCKKTYDSWMKLIPKYPDGARVKKPRLNPVDGAVTAHLSIMKRSKFKDYVDALDMEYGIQPKDRESADNIRKLAIAAERLNKVVIVRFNDTNEQRVSLLTQTVSGRIVLREVIPANLVKVKETMFMGKILEKDINEAKAFIRTLAKADDKVMVVADYRVEGLRRTTEHEEDLKALARIGAEIEESKKLEGKNVKT